MKPDIPARKDATRLAFPFGKLFIKISKTTVVIVRTIPAAIPLFLTSATLYFS